MIKLFVTDLDGTLLKDNTYVTEQDRLTIQALFKQGIDIAVASGRSDQEIVQLFKDIEIDGHRVSQNGTFVVDVNHQLVVKQHFEAKLSQALLAKVKTYPVHYFISTADHIHYDNETDFVRDVQKLFKFPLKHSPNIAEEIGSNYNISKFMLLAEKETLLPIQKEINQTFPGQIESFMSASRCVDIVPVGVNKGNGLIKLIKKLNIKPEEVAVVGDAHNDIDMLRMTPHSYVMNSADDDVKKQAQHEVEHVHQAIKDLKERKLL
ncbi:HAD family hydrolase [Amphibacillus cookii]|uniref:HAD family hydrolase n=1 Tax=Amphibacillus cookii TaxID=767787 RepID=UPI00195F0BF0|nr:HAD family hydrolase [Amphibacillus cookii]MBM7542149.1 Cof subfamily protein (haloacid dehalogenase superfamily) [Amphibacillus cookii]